MSEQIRCLKCSGPIQPGVLVCPACGALANTWRLMPGADSGEIRTHPAARERPGTLFRLASPKKEDSDHAPAMLRVSPQQMEGGADALRGECPDFTIKWHLASSVLVSGEPTTLRFWILPQTGGDAAPSVSGARVYLQFPGQHYPHEANAVPRTLSGPVAWKTEYCPGPQDVGLDQRIKFVFSYLRNHRAVSFAQQLSIDILPEGTDQDGLLTRVCDRLQAVAALNSGDEARAAAYAVLHNAASDTGEGAVTRLATLDRESLLAVPLHLFAVDDPSRTVMHTERLEIGERPDTVKPCIQATVKAADGSSFDIYSGSVSLAEGKASVVVDASQTLLVSGACRDGTWVSVAPDAEIDGELAGFPAAISAGDKRTVSIGGESYTVHAYHCAAFAQRLAPSVRDGVPDRNIAAATVGRDDQHACQLLLPYWLPIRELVPDVAPEWLICRRDGAFGVTDGREWWWLGGEDELPEACGITYDSQR